MNYSVAVLLHSMQTLKRIVINLHNNIDISVTNVYKKNTNIIGDILTC